MRDQTMAQSIEQAEQTQRLEAAMQSRQMTMARDAGLVVGASVLMAISAHIAFPLFFSPVPVTMQPLAMLLIAFFLGPRRAAASMIVYLCEGLSGLPVFSPAGLGGFLQLAGPTGGFLMATPFAAFIAGWIARKKSVVFLVLAALSAEVVLFTFGASWFIVATHATFAGAMSLAVLPFLPGEVLKMAIAVSAASLWNRQRT
jgi:biotin transport system substrate-specific component